MYPRFSNVRKTWNFKEEEEDYDDDGLAPQAEYRARSRATLILQLPPIVFIRVIPPAYRRKKFTCLSLIPRRREAQAA